MSQYFNFATLKQAGKLSLLGFFLPVLPMLKSIALLIILDIILGMYVAKVIKKQDLTSKKFREKIHQVAIFAIGLCSILLADSSLQVFGIDEHYGAKLYVALYAFYELFSILENLGDAGLPIAKEIRGFLLAKKNDIIKKEEDQNGDKG